MFHQLGEQMRMALRSIASFVTKITVIVRQNFPAVDGVFTSTSTGFKQCLVKPFPFSKSREEFEILRNRFICVYPVQLEGTPSEDEVPALSIGSLEQGCVLMVGMQDVLTVRVPMRWA